MFSLKLRLYELEGILERNAPGDGAAALQENVEMRVKIKQLEQELEEKTQLLLKVRPPGPTPPAPASCSTAIHVLYIAPPSLSSYKARAALDRYSADEETRVADLKAAVRDLRGTGAGQ